MKKILSIAMLVMTCSVMIAQTNFRDITYKQALAAARVEHKLVFMDFYTDWCGPCKLMAREVFPTTTVGDYFNDKFVSIKVNAEKGEGVDIAKIYKLEAYPTFVVVDADEKEQFRLVGYSPTDEFIKKVKREMDPTLTPEKMQQLYEAGNRSTSLIKAYAAYQVEQLNRSRNSTSDYAANRRKINEMVQSYFAQLSDTQRMSAENLFVYRNYTDRTTDLAGRYMLAHKGQFGESNVLVDSIMQVLYNNNLYSYVSGRIGYEASAYQIFVEEFKTLGYNRDGSYDLPFMFVDAAQQGMDSYLSCFDRNFAMLSREYKFAAMLGILNRYATGDYATRRRASQSIRNQMPDMDANMLYNVVTYINQIEEK